jgi:hypothetical protein
VTEQTQNRRTRPLRGFLPADWLELGGAGVLLSFATWLYVGYIYPIYPQSGFLDWVYRLDGQYTKDFHTDHPPIHWAFAHVLGWLPIGMIGPALLVAWIAGLMFLWVGFVSICKTLGASTAGAVAAGLIAMGTTFYGLGLQPEIFGISYPTMISFGISVAGLAALLRERLVLAGALMGLATLVHPNLGLLTTAAFAPALLVGAWGRWGSALRSDLPRVAVPWAILGLPAMIAVAKGQVSGGTLTEKQSFDLLTVVRAPHHYLYSAYAGAEYIQTAAWAAVFVVALLLAWRPGSVRPDLMRPEVMRRLALVGLAVVAICGAGAIASAAGKPFVLVSALTARVSSVMILLGTVSAAALISRAYRGWAPAVLAGIFLLAPFFAASISLPQKYFAIGSLSTVEAGLVLITVALALLAEALGRRDRLRERDGGPGTPAVMVAAVGAIFAACAFSLAVKHGDRAIIRGAENAAFIDVSAKARADSRRDTVFLSPPELDGFRSFARRGTVTEFGTIEFGAGDAEWQRRMIDVTGNPLTISPAFGSDVIARNKLIGDSYTQRLATSRQPICRYGVTRVVSRVGLQMPPWLELVYRNDYFELLNVRPGTCAGAKP